MSKVETSYEKILREHQELHEYAQSLRSFLQGERPAIGQKGSHSWAAALASRLVGLHDKIFVHFREEEESGFMADVERWHPHAINQVDVLRKEHQEILGGFRSLLDAAMKYSEWKGPDDIHLRRESHALLDKLREHESAETEFIQRVSIEEFGRGI